MEGVGGTNEDSGLHANFLLLPSAQSSTY